MDNMYFAEKDVEEIGCDLKRIVEDYYNFIQSNKLWDIWKNSYTKYNAGYFMSGRAHLVGEGDTLKVSVNHYRNLIQHQIALITGTRLHFEPKSVNTDYKSMAQTVVAKGILEYYMRAKHVESKVTQCVETAIVYGESGLYTRWNPELGDIVEFEGSERKTGDIESFVLTPLEVIRDVRRKSTENHDWYIVTRYVNKYELAAEYPDFQEHIENMSSQILNRMSSLFFDNLVFTGSSNTDIIPVYTLLHKRTARIPNGKLVTFLEDETVLEYRNMPYEEFPLALMIPNSLQGTPFGYSLAFDLLSLQQIYNGTSSSIATAHNAFGVQTVMLPKGSDLDIHSLSEGLNAIVVDPTTGPPKILELLQIPPEQYRHLDHTERTMETLAGINSVTRGNPEASLKSGAALALVQSMAIQFGSLQQNAYAQFGENVGTSYISILKQFAKVPRIAMISGISNRANVKQFTSDDLTSITRVYVDFGNPLQRTIAGRVNMAESFLEKGMITTPEEYMSVVETGRYEPLIENQRNELFLIKSENESLTNGIQAPTLAIDQHIIHIKEHKAVLSSPDIRTRQEIVGTVLDHIQQHIEMMKTIDPSLLKIVGVEPIPPPPPPPPPKEPSITISFKDLPEFAQMAVLSQMGMQVPSEQPPSLEMNEVTTETPKNPKITAAKMMIPATGQELPNMPSGPTNPLTGEKFQLPKAGPVV